MTLSPFHITPAAAQAGGYTTHSLPRRPAKGWEIGGLTIAVEDEALDLLEEGHLVLVASALGSWG